MYRHVIDLNNMISKKIKVLSGRKQGENARTILGIESKDKDELSYNIIIPSEIRTLNPSYFLGLFSLSIDYLGLEKFKEKYNFTSDTETGDLRENIRKDIEEGIEWALDELEVLH